MFDSKQSQRTIYTGSQDDYLSVWMDGFLLDRKAANVAPGTLRFYVFKLRLFNQFCETQLITRIHQLTPDVIRRFMMWLESNGHNPGGVHGCYRALKAFLFWWEGETEPDGWKNPIRKVKAPRVGLEPIEPVDLSTVQSMLDTCERKTFTGDRDRAALLVLLDTGARAAEFCAMNLTDFDIVTGEILIRQGKGSKPRTVYLSPTSRRAVRAYLKYRQEQDITSALWLNVEGARLAYGGLRALLRRRAKLARVEAPTLHDFRRAFALNMLRAGVDVFTLQKLMGHADLQVLRRYLAQNGQDTMEAHRRASPVEHGL